MILLKDISVIFYSKKSELIALKDFNLSIGNNEFVSIVGLSGCGKTTLINLLAGFLRPTTGQVIFEGKIVEKPSVERVVVSQEDSVFPWYSVKENIGYALDIEGISKEDKNKVVIKYLDAVGLSSFYNFFPKDISGGMKKRVDLARAYAAKPKVLLMDEPFGALDTYTRQQMQLLLLSLCESDKKTIIFVTHDISEAIFLSDKVVLMTSRPGSVYKIFNIPFERPRKTEIKKTNAFLEIYSEIEELVRSQDKSNA